jgi:hypothetical protein
MSMCPVVYAFSPWYLPTYICGAFLTADFVDGFVLWLMTWVPILLQFSVVLSIATNIFLGLKISSFAHRIAQDAERNYYSSVALEEFYKECVKPFGKRGSRESKLQWAKCHPDKANLVARFGAECAAALEPLIGGPYTNRFIRPAACA